jgi:adenylate cyclase class IV
MARNVEVKIAVEGLDALRDRALELGAEDRGAIDQVDTYFVLPPDSGARLKLREQRPGRDELIAYRRPDEAGLRTSDYRVVPLADAAATREALALSLGVARRVAKRRHLLLLGRTRVHLDRVEGRGEFLELEVVLARDEGDVEGEREAERILAGLGLGDRPRIAGSYGDA